MQDEFGPVLASVHRICAQFPGGITSIVSLLIEEDGDKPRARSTLYGDLNPYQSSLGKLKARDMYKFMKIAQNYEPLRILAGMCGFYLLSMANDEPDAPTVEAEMLQDYPAVVEFHQAIQAYKRGEVSFVNVIAKLDNATSDLRQTAAMARQEKS